MKREKLVSGLLKGFVIGGTMTVPGVSGGTMAILLGIYDGLLSAVNKVWKDGGKSFLFLLMVALGGGMGLITCSGVVMHILEKYPLYCGYFFMGAIAGGIPLLYHSAKVEKVGVETMLWPVLGVGTIWGIGKLPRDLLQVNTEGGVELWIIQVLCGLLLAIALILPGISVSHMLLLLGLYEFVMDEVKEFRFLSLMPLAVGIGVGVLLFARYLEKAMERAPRITYLWILGFVVSSLFHIFPGVPKGNTVFLSVLFLLIGFLCTFYLSKREGDGEKEE